MDHTVSKLIAENEHLKQTYKKLSDLIKLTHTRSKEQCDDLINQVNLKSMEIFDLNASLQEKVLVITALKDDLRKLKGKALVDNDVTKHPSDPEMLKIDELLTNISKTCPSINNADGKLVAVTPKNKDKRFRFIEPITSSGNTNTKTSSSSNLVSNKPMLSFIRVKPSTSASGSQPSDCVVAPKGTANVQHSKLNANFKLKCVKCNGCMLSDNHDLCILDFINNVNARTKYKSFKKNSKRKVWKPTGKVLKSVSANKKEPSQSWGSIVSDVPSFSLDECRSSKLFSVKFENDHVAKILGYSDYRIGNVTISRVYYVEGLGHNLFSVTQFCDSNLEIAFRQHTCFIRNLEGFDLLTGSRGNNLYTLSLGDMMASSPICLLLKDSKTNLGLGTDVYNGIEFVNQTLREYYEMIGVSHETSISRSPQQNGVIERQVQVAPPCYTQNRSIIRLRHGKTPYELLHDKLPDLSFFHVFGALCYPTNDSENLGKLQPKADIGIFIGYAPTKKAFRIYNRRTRRIIETIHVDFDELTAMASEHSSSGPALHEMTPATITPEVITPIAKVVAPEPVVSTGSLSSTTVDQDAPSPSNSQTTPKTQSPILPNDVEENNHDLDVAYMNNDPFFGIPIPENESEASSSSDVIPTVVQSGAPYSEHVTKWTKDHPLDNVIVEPKTYKDALTQSCWIEAMQEELNEFERLEVWELVPRLDKVMTAFLNGILREEVYISQQDGFMDQDNLNHVYKLKKALYGLKQAPRAWYNLLSKFLLSQEFSKGIVDPTLFIRRQGKDLLLVQIYVDNIIFASTTPELCDQFSKIMCSQFKTSMMGKILFFLRLPILQSPRGIFINQSKYALESLKKYGMESSDPVDTPMVKKSKLDEDTQGKAVDPTHYRGMIGTLMYLTASRLDRTFVVCMCARLVSWSSKRQKSAAISSIEAGYIAMSGCCAQILWMRSWLTDFGLGFNKIPMYCDNKSVIALCCNNVQHSRSKHIDIRFHFIKEQVENGVVELYFVNTKYQLADNFSKSLCRERIEFLINKLGMRSFTPETLKQLADEAEE
ncbi:retrovirus-related pol polyprotein from transposon TNT 1-94 [Tanacetum coccineum]|uniref:Retrovirus-related pol polyprotein from transposon TNT 1-94 n=1 Tax=Tanacetum coccineum TaxID=301880 RepID=A0ABQ5EGA6_9ASTR